MRIALVFMAIVLMSTASATCALRTGFEKEYFYGATLTGEWHTSTSEMQIDFTTPQTVVITSIAFEGATTPDVLAYSVATPAPWVVEPNAADACGPTKYILKQPQTTFFGPGSKFTMNGLSLTGTLKIVSSEAITQTIGAETYNYNRLMTNLLPVKIDLLDKVVVNANFHTKYNSRSSVELVNDFDATLSTTALQTTFKTECDAKYATSHAGVTCELPTKKTGTGETNTILTFSGTQSKINDIINTIEKVDTKLNLGSFGDMPAVQPPQTHDEFVFFESATQNTDESLDIIMKVHSRSCIDHTKQGTNKGIKVSDADASDHIDGTSTFTWADDGAATPTITVSIERDLCVERVTWHFKPKVPTSDAFKINLELDLLNGLGTFVAESQVNIAVQNVLKSIPITNTFKTYSDEAMTTEDGFFALGEVVVIRVDLVPIVECASITIDRMYIEQTSSGSSPVTTKTPWKGALDDGTVAESKYNYAQIDLGATVKNSVAMKGELESTHFHIDVDGWATKAVIDLTVTYKQGVVSRLRIRRNLGWNNEYSVGSLKAAQTQPAGAVVPFHIVAPEKTVAGALLEAAIPTGHISRLALGFGLLTGGFLAFKAYKNGKEEEYNPLMEI